MSGDVEDQRAGEGQEVVKVGERVLGEGMGGVVGDFPGIGRLPPEMWELIFDNLIQSMDCWNVSEAVPWFADILSVCKQSWLYEQVFHFLFPLLSKTDILHCRVVSKRWRYAVDHFLENNPYHRPASSQTYLQGRVLPMLALLCAKKMVYNNFTNATRMAGPLKEHANFPLSSLVGSSCCLKETDQTLEHQPGNLDFLKVFGHNIFFLKLAIANLPPDQICERILALVQLTPHLKKLEIFGGISPVYVLRSRLNTRQALQRVQTLTEDLEQRLTEWTALLPKLETLDCEMSGLCHVEIKRYIFLAFNGAKCLQSLALNLMAFQPDMEFNTLVDLSIPLDGNESLDCLRSLKAPLKRLMVHVLQQVNTQKLLNLPRVFGTTMCNFGMHIPIDFSPQSGSDPTAHFGLTEPFTNLQIWDDLPILKRVSLKGTLPLSLNFLWGLRDHLEWLHLAPVNRSAALEERFRDAPSGTRACSCSAFWSQCTPERVDLLKKITEMGRQERKGKTLYDTDLWTEFPRLRLMTVRLETNDGQPYDTLSEREYTRERFERRREIANAQGN